MVQPILLEGDLAEMQCTAWHLEFHLRRGFGKKIAAAKARFAVASFDESFTLPIEAFFIPYAGNFAGNIVCHYFRLAVGEYAGLGQRLAD